MTVKHRILIVGDFNFHVDDLTDRAAARFVDLITSFNFKQHVIVPTHRDGHTLDLMFLSCICNRFEPLKFRVGTQNMMRKLRRLCSMVFIYLQQKPLWSITAKTNCCHKGPHSHVTPMNWFSSKQSRLCSQITINRHTKITIKTKSVPSSKVSGMRVVIHVCSKAEQRNVLAVYPILRNIPPPLILITLI